MPEHLRRLDTPLTEDPDMNWNLPVWFSVPLELERAVRAGPQPESPLVADSGLRRHGSGTRVSGPGGGEDGTGCSAQAGPLDSGMLRPSAQRHLVH